MSRAALTLSCCLVLSSACTDRKAAGSELETGETGEPGETGDMEAEDAITGAGWSFGECVGACVGRLVIKDDELLAFSIEDWMTQIVGQNGGTLTLEGRAQLDAAVAELVGVELDEVYGCPDCTDGGASFIDLRRGGVASSHVYELANPPAVLGPADALIVEIMLALQDCSASELVVLEEGCVPIDP